MAAKSSWVADITYIRTGDGWLYLAAIIDLGSRRVVGWSLNERMTKQLVCSALTMAWWQRQPPPNLIMHADRGSQYASKRYRLLLKDYAMTASMIRKTNCWDNSPMESFFKTLKVELVYRQRYASPAHARLDIVNWIEGFYNRERLHSSIGYQSPVNAEYSLSAA